MSVSSPNKTVSDGLDTAIGRRHLGGFLETPAATGDEAWTREEQSPVLIRQLKLPKRDAQDQKWEDQQHVAVPAGFQYQPAPKRRQPPPRPWTALVWKPESSEPSEPLQERQQPARTKNSPRTHAPGLQRRSDDGQPASGTNHTPKTFTLPLACGWGGGHGPGKNAVPSSPHNPQKTAFAKVAGKVFSPRPQPISPRELARSVAGVKSTVMDQGPSLLSSRIPLAALEAEQAEHDRADTASECLSGVPFGLSTERPSDAEDMQSADIAALDLGKIQRNSHPKGSPQMSHDDIMQGQVMITV